MKQYTLEFVNKGSPFEMPKWTLAKHEELLEEMIPYDEKLKLHVITKIEYDKIYRTAMILSSLHEIDKKVTEKDLENMHPDDLIELWTTVYTSGKKGIVVNNNADFQTGE